MKGLRLEFLFHFNTSIFLLEWETWMKGLRLYVLKNINSEPSAQLEWETWMKGLRQRSFLWDKRIFKHLLEWETWMKGLRPECVSGISQLPLFVGMRDLNEGIATRAAPGEKEFKCGSLWLEWETWMKGLRPRNYGRDKSPSTLHGWNERPEWRDCDWRLVFLI